MLPVVTVVGNVKFMETKFTSSGSQVTSLVVSCSEKKKDGEYENLNIKAEFWNKTAEFVNNYFNDGDPIIVTGKLVTNSWEQDGQKRHEIKFLFPTASFVPKAKDGNAQPTQQPTVEYQNAQGQPITQQQSQQAMQQQQYQQPTQQARQMPPQNVPEIDVNSEEIPF